MAGVRQLAVSGLRSFGGEERDQQFIRFQRPLTLILGENGCGKTTLVEALKFALCDELPPNSDHGRSFVHDPKVASTRETRGQVRLEFTDINQKNYLVARSVQTQIKQKKMQFQRLENFIKTIDDEGNTVEISGRCGDTNNTIASILGVSKAILNNVIFCHQEESNWPLEEGKKLKERFDSIFDATKYNKCFEYIRKMRKQYAIDIKLLEQEIRHLSEKKEELDNKKRVLYTNEEKIKDANSKLRELRDQLEPIKCRLSEIDAIENNFVELKSAKEMSRARLENCKTQQKNLLNNIKKKFIGTDEELKDEIKSFEKNLQNKESYLNTASKRVDNLKKKELDVNKKISINDIKKGELFTLEGQNQEKISIRNKQLSDIAKFIGIQEINISEDDDGSSVMETIKDKYSSVQQNCKEIMKTIDTKDKELQCNIDTCRDSLTKHKQTIRNKEDERQHILNQINKLQADISDANDAKSNIEILKSQLDTSENEYQNIIKEFDPKVSEESINNFEMEIATLEAELEQWNDMVSKIQVYQTQIKEIEFQKDALNSKQKHFARIKNKHKESMIKLLGDKIPENNFKKALQECKESLKIEISKLNKQLKGKQDQLTVLETNRNHTKKELDIKKQELSSYEEQIYKYCKAQALEDVLTKLDTDINKLQEQKSELSSTEFVIQKFVDKLKETDPCCPLCHRGFDSQHEVSELVNELQEKIYSVPKTLELVSNRLCKETKERDEIVSLRPLEKKVAELKYKEIPSLQTKLNEMDSQINSLSDNIEECTMSITEPENKYTSVDSVLPDMSLLDQLLHEITTLSTEISKLEGNLEPLKNSSTLEDANSKQTIIKEEISTLKTTMKLNQSKLKKHNEKLNKICEKKNRCKEEYLKAQYAIQDLVSLQTRHDELTESVNKIKLELSDFNKQIPTLSDNLQTAELNKKNVIHDLRNDLDKNRKLESQLDKKLNAVSVINNEIVNHHKKDIPNELSKIKHLTEQLNEEKEKILDDIKDETLRITEIKDDISNQMINKRELDDNLCLRQYKNDQNELESKIKNIDEEVGELKYEIISKEKQKLISKENSSILEIARTEGEVKQLKETIGQINKDLTQKQYKNIQQKYKTQLYELELLKISDKDIKDYAFAMDCCLMKYHKDKMEKINFIIRDLWRTIYRGNDIDYIEIKTDESTSTTATGNRRVYDYRVIQRRNDAEIDMRGRCSAGQKVLASLIIRMALAETFSCKFGVLALDEPTTNLDRENVTSLCYALREMVMSRMKQNNFMFIIITHDAEFLTSLGRIDKLRHYYKVTRNRDGKSRITKEIMQ